MAVNPWTRVLFRALDAVYTAPLRPARGSWALLGEALRCTSNFDRVAALDGLLTNHLPSIMSRVRARLHDAGFVPIRTTRVRPFAFGQGSSCVILEGEVPRVLKIFRESLGQDVPQLVAFARRLRDGYETLARWYGSVPAVLPRTAHLVLHAPLRGAGAAARIQDLVTGTAAHDLLDRRHERRLLELMRCSPELTRNVRSFVQATRRTWDCDGRCLDIGGPNNVVIVEQATGPQLRIVDFGIWDLANVRRRSPRVYDRAARALSRLERVTIGLDAV